MLIHVIGSIMKNNVFLLVIMLVTLYSCKSIKQLASNDEYTITNLVLKKYNDIPIFRLIMKPENSLVVRYKNGILDDSLYFKNTGFSLKKDRIYNWNKNIALGDKSLKKRIDIIEDFSKIKKVDPLDSQTFISLSNLMYSDDKKYAAIIMNVFHNTNVGDSTAEGYILIYERIDDKWHFVIEVVAYLT